MEPPVVFQCVSSLTVVSAAIVRTCDGSARSVATAALARFRASVQAGSVVAMSAAFAWSWFGANTMMLILTSSPSPGWP